MDRDTMSSAGDIITEEVGGQKPSCAIIGLFNRVPRCKEQLRKLPRLLDPTFHLIFIAKLYNIPTQTHDQ